MRPTPAELAKGLRALLRPLGGELASAAAWRDLRRAMHVLREARWNDAAFDLIAENKRLADALREAGAGEPIDETMPLSFAEAEARNRALREALCRLIDAMAEKPLAESAALRGRLTAILTRRR